MLRLAFTTQIHKIMNIQQQKPQPDGLALLQQFGLMDNPIAQLGGLLQAMQMIEESDRWARKLDLDERQIAQREMYDNTMLGLQQKELEAQLARQEQEDALRRAQMVTQWGISTEPGLLNRDVMGEIFSRAQMPGLFNPQPQVNSGMNPLSGLIANDLNAWQGFNGWQK